MTFALLLYSESSVELSAKTTSFPAIRCNFESTNINSCVHLILDSPLADVGGVGPQPADGQLSLGVALNGRLGLHLDSGQAVTTITMTDSYLAAGQIHPGVGVDIVPARNLTQCDINQGRF